MRDYVRGTLPGADASVPNSVLRVLSDSQGALCHLNLQYLDWLALQLLPDTAETEWLDRHGDIWLVNSDGSAGRKVATLASGSVYITGISGTIVPAHTQLSGLDIGYETTAEIVIGVGPSEAQVRALDPGIDGNRDPGETLSVSTSIPGIDNTATIITLTGGVDTESDEQLRARVLQRIRNPPMGGTQANYITWALSVPGVTRAWAFPEQGPGTITVRFLMDDLHADDNGWPTPSDEQIVHNYINKMRPVTVMDCYVFGPIKWYINIVIANMVPNVLPPYGDLNVSGAIENSLKAMLYEKAAPGQTIYAAWISYAIMDAAGVQSFDLLTNSDFVMPAPGYMAVLGTITYT